MSYDSHCVECDKPISDEYERCYECNQEHGGETVWVGPVEVLHQKGDGIKVSVDGDVSWYPQAEVQIRDDTMYLPRWLAEKQELEYTEASTREV